RWTTTRASGTSARSTAGRTAFRTTTSAATRATSRTRTRSIFSSRSGGERHGMARIDEDRARFNVTCGGYTLECTPCGLPLIYDRLSQNAVRGEEFALRDPSHCCLTVRRAGQPWPFLVVAQSYEPAGVGFEPGVLLALETKVLFVGAGERIL